MKMTTTLCIYIFEKVEMDNHLLGSKGNIVLSRRIKAVALNFTKPNRLVLKLKITKVGLDF